MVMSDVERVHTDTANSSVVDITIPTGILYDAQVGWKNLPQVHSYNRNHGLCICVHRYG